MSVSHDDLSISLHSKLIRFLSADDADTVLRILQGRSERIEGTSLEAWASDALDDGYDRASWLHGFHTGLGILHNHITRRDFGAMT